MLFYFVSGFFQKCKVYGLWAFFYGPITVTFIMFNMSRIGGKKGIVSVGTDTVRNSGFQVDRWIVGRLT
jgi:hypothetical protein